MFNQIHYIMKKIVMMALMVASTSVALAQDPVKEISKADTYEQAASILKSNLGSMSNEVKAKAYGALVEKAMAKYNKESAVAAANQAAEQLQTGKVEPFDTLGMYTALEQAFDAAYECDKADMQPNEKGKIKPKFRSKNAKLLLPNRLQLINGGQYFGNKNDNKGLLRQFGKYVDSRDWELFSEEEAAKQPDQYLSQIAFYAGRSALVENDFASADRYLKIAAADPEYKKDAIDLQIYSAQHQAKTHEDSVKVMNQLETLYAENPDNDRIFGTLCSMYSNLGQAEKSKELITKALANNPGNAMALELRGQTYMNDKKYDEAIADFKKALETDGENSLILVYLGFCQNNKAAQLSDQLADKNGMITKENAEKIKAAYAESIPYLEKARQVDPDRQRANWVYPLYSAYYAVKGAEDPATKEIEAMMNNK